MINVSFPDDVVAQIDSARASGPGRPEVKRAAWVAWATAQFIAEHSREWERPVAKLPLRRRNAVYSPPRLLDARPVPHAQAEGTALAAAREQTEGDRLRAARLKTGLTHEAMGEACASVSDGPRTYAALSRGQVQRAERAATLDQWPALRAWLEGQERAAKGDAP